MAAMTHIPRVPTSAKSLATNPLKMSAPLGGALAFMGVDNCLPLFHGSQGCTAFGMVLLVRHFRDAVPLHTTAMDQVATIMVGYGYTAIVVAWLARLRPLPIAFAAYLLAALRVGVEVMQLELQIPAAFGQIMEGSILLCVIAGQFFLTSSVHLRRAHPADNAGRAVSTEARP